MGLELNLRCPMIPQIRALLALVKLPSPASQVCRSCGRQQPSQERPPCCEAAVRARLDCRMACSLTDILGRRLAPPGWLCWLSKNSGACGCDSSGSTAVDGQPCMQASNDVRFDCLQFHRMHKENRIAATAPAAPPSRGSPACRDERCGYKFHVGSS